MCPVTSRVKRYPFEVVPPEGHEVCGAILADQVNSLDWRARGAELYCRLPDSTTNEVIAKLSALIV